MKLKGYKKGTSHVPKNDDYLIQEDGKELIYDKSEGALLEPKTSEPMVKRLNIGDMVFRNESVKRLYEIIEAGGLGAVTGGNIMPTINPVMDNMKKMADSLQTVNNVNTTNEIHMDGDVNINLPGVTNYDDFSKRLFRDNNFKRGIFTLVGNEMMGKNSLEVRNYSR